jgi:hypothetical protein
MRAPHRVAALAARSLEHARDRACEGREPVGGTARPTGRDSGGSDSRRRCQLRNHCERGRAHLAHAPAPALAEGRPGAQPLQEGQTLVADRLDQRGGIRALRRGDGVGPDLAVHGRGDQPLQHLGGAADPRIDAIVEHGVVDAGGEIVAAQRVPVVLPVDGLDLILRRAPHVRGQTGMAAAPDVPFALQNAARGAPAGIAGIVVIAPFVHEQARERLAI